MRKLLVFISVTLALLFSLEVGAQDLTFPEKDGDSLQCNALIEMPKGYVSGICILLHENDTIKGAIINEFGITAVDFCYLLSKDRVKLGNVVAMLDKWYIKKVLRKDIRQWLVGLRQGKTVYKDEKYHITYSLTPMDKE